MDSKTALKFTKLLETESGVSCTITGNWGPSRFIGAIYIYLQELGDFKKPFWPIKPDNEHLFSKLPIWTGAEVFDTYGNFK
jgi:hypothetical protein